MTDENLDGLLGPSRQRHATTPTASSGPAVIPSQKELDHFFGPRPTRIRRTTKEPTTPPSRDMPMWRF